jgi:hypothetical protein
MKREKAIEILGSEASQQAIEAGKLWGKQEAELYRDQNEGKELPDWTLGTWLGELPFEAGEEKQDAYETLLDLAARDAWNAE